MNSEFIELYLENQGGSLVHGDNGQHMCLDCPWCGKAKHLYVNTRPRGRGILGGYKCFRCEEGGRNFTNLYAVIEGLDFKQALAALAREARGEFRRLPHSKVDKQEPKELPPQIIPWPDEYKPVCDGGVCNMPVYLANRGMSAKIAAEYELGFCEDGEYAGRIILPIRSPSKQSWTSRATDDREPRYKAGPGAGRLLFGWQQAQGAKHLVITEGPFDTMAVRQTGLRSVGLMGLRLREYQVELIRAMRCKRIIWMLDDSAISDAISQAARLPGENMIAAPLGYKDAACAVEAGDIAAIKRSVNSAVHRADAHLAKILAMVNKTRHS